MIEISQKYFRKGMNLLFSLPFFFFLSSVPFYDVDSQEKSSGTMKTVYIFTFFSGILLSLSVLLIENFYQ